MYGAEIIARRKGEEVKRSRYEKKSSATRQDEEEDLRTFKLIECFFETAPSLYLQLYIIIDGAKTYSSKSGIRTSTLSTCCCYMERKQHSAQITELMLKQHSAQLTELVWLHEC